MDLQRMRADLGHVADQDTEAREHLRQLAQPWVSQPRTPAERRASQAVQDAALRYIYAQELR